MDYPRDLIVAILNYSEEIRSCVERVTGNATASIYSFTPISELSEGHTLDDHSPKGTRFASRHTLRETLLDMVVDIDMARSRLSPEENLSLGIVYILRPSFRIMQEVSELAGVALDKVYHDLNGLEYLP